MIAQHQRALSHWENEGGACLRQSGTAATGGKRHSAEPPLANAELLQLRIRVIALENLMIAVLAASPDRRLERARELACHISPRPGFTPHRLTIRAAAQMVHLIERAGFFRVADGSTGRTGDAKRAARS